MPGFEVVTRRPAIPTPSASPGAGVATHRDHIFNDRRVDPYQPRGKYRSPTVCPDCGAVFRRGRWALAPAPDGAQHDVCPACRRIREKLPAGTLTLEGPFYESHRGELMRLVRNEAESEREQHPMNRIMTVDEHGDHAIVSTTDIHTPHRIGNALERSYQGDLEVQYGDHEYSVRVQWRR
jgi:hypothetical protein